MGKAFSKKIERVSGWMYTVFLRMRKRKLIGIGLGILLLGCIALLLFIKKPVHVIRSVPAVLNQPTSPMASPAVSHIAVIVMENKSSDQIIGNVDAPFINSLISRFASADAYSSVGNPSLPNYLALLGGSTFGITSDCTDCTISAPNLVDQLEEAHKTWKAYMESMPQECFFTSTNLYAQKHDPFVYFDDIRENRERCSRVVPFSTLDTDLATARSTPNFLFITPNICNDMHDCSVATGDLWLQSLISRLLSSPAFTSQRSLIILTWDEGEGRNKNTVPVIFAGNLAKKGFVSPTAYSHYSLLHTIEDIWNMPLLTQAVAQSNSMNDMVAR